MTSQTRRAARLQRIRNNKLRRANGSRATSRRYSGECLQRKLDDLAAGGRMYLDLLRGYGA